jgi:hypothetical protein
VPSLKAEFGHPDVAITLTCLSYYYGGLSQAQVLQCLERLFKLDDPTHEYDQWVDIATDDVPVEIQRLSGINMNDTELLEKLVVPTFEMNYVVINFFLTQIVFPREAKEFPHKLGTSAWDLAERKTMVTTGFSGTRDSRFLLPTSIKQVDLAEQRGTDALVLSYLLQPENTYHASNDRLTDQDYLQIIVDQEEDIRVLLDVGAQILSMRNEEVAQQWLRMRHDIDAVSAAVFFTDADELVVLSRDGTVELLRSSPYVDQLDKCIIYLDDAHTRGTDLKLPTNTRAALTLGQKVTKDRLVQGKSLKMYLYT